MNYDSLLKVVSDQYMASWKGIVLENMQAHAAFMERMYPDQYAERKRLQAIGPVHGPEPVTLTVGELIERLQQLDPNAEVGTADSEWGYEPYDITSEFELDDEGRLSL